MTDIQLKWNFGVQVHKDNIWRTAGGRDVFGCT